LRGICARPFVRDAHRAARRFYSPVNVAIKRGKFILGGVDLIDKYNKLVRDKIPDIIMRQGDCPKVEILDDESYLNALNHKLTEETAEYLGNHSIDELADIVEVIYALVKYKGLTLNDFDILRLRKHNERGGFDNRISLIEVERNQTV